MHVGTHGLSIKSTRVIWSLELITSSDREYLATKRIKQGKARLASPFDELAAWIASKWNVSVLNIVYDRANELHAPRLQVILEQDHDKAKFQQDGLNFDSEKQEAIKDQFLNIINRQSSHGFDVAGLFVVFSAFAPIAREEADSNLTDQQINELKNRLANPDLWEIVRCFGQVTFMFYTDEQVASYTVQGKKAEYARKYFEILKPNDEFGYISLKQFSVHFDSKQNFDTNYQGNWFSYFR